MKHPILRTVAVAILGLACLLAVGLPRECVAAAVGCPPGVMPVSWGGTGAWCTASYLSIQTAMNDASVVAGWTVFIDAGTYQENLVVSKPVALRGAGQDATVIEPAVSNPTCVGGGGGTLCDGIGPASSVILVQSSGVSVLDLTVDGDNPSLTSGVIAGGADLDSRTGIVTNHLLGIYQDLEVGNVTVRNIYLRAVYASSGGSFNFHGNTVTNVQGESGSIALFNFGGTGVMTGNTVVDASYALVANWSTGTQFTGNTVISSGSGVNTDNTDGPDLIAYNTVRDGDPDCWGFWVSTPNQPVTVDHNEVAGVAVGLAAIGQGAAVTTVFSNNTVDSATEAAVYATTYLFGYGSADVSASFTNNTLLRSAHGVYVEPETGYVATVSGTGNCIASNTVGAGLAPASTYGGTANVNLANNWWGDVTGPFNATTNPGGLGNPVVNGIVYVPFNTTSQCAAPLLFDLTLARDGTGSGTVSSSPAGIDCGTACSARYYRGTTVTLTPSAAPDSDFTGWTGACTGTGVCTVTMDQARSVTATFTLARVTLTVAVTGSGAGSVTSAPGGIDCGATCSAFFALGGQVRLDPTPGAGSVFKEWTGDCTGSGACVLTMDVPHAVTAVFASGQLEPVLLQIDPPPASGALGNGVLEPGETVAFYPAWRSTGAESLAVTGSLAGFGDGFGGSWPIDDGAASYGTMAQGLTVDSRAATGNSYVLTLPVPAQRPATHWDVQVTETMSAGTGHTWHIHVGGSFTDVPTSYLLYRFVEELFHSGVTLGCSGTTYCPSGSVSRAQMAMFIARAMAGSDGAVPATGLVGAVPYDCSLNGQSLFTDVAPTAQYCRHVHYIAAAGVTLGCTTTTYCPASPVTRAAMAMFVARAIAGGDAAVPTAYTNPGSGRAYDCGPSPVLYFTDVLASAQYCRHAHYLWATSVIVGCVASPPQYCPTPVVTRGQMAKFLVNGFELSMYQP